MEADKTQRGKGNHIALRVDVRLSTLSIMQVYIFQFNVLVARAYAEALQVGHATLSSLNTCMYTVYLFLNLHEKHIDEDTAIPDSQSVGHEVLLYHFRLP